ncbi:MAG: (d)CMP kinase [Candidatus Eisenbacteria bacterium]
MITIDGPAAAGKSTTARAVARHLGCLYLDSGAMYRAFGLKVERLGLSAVLAQVAAGSAEGLGRIDELARTTTIGFTGPKDDPAVVLDGASLGDEIRTPRVSELASRVATIPVVRARMNELQRQIAARESLVAEGRDMGTVLFPDAPVKIFLDASVEERARRRQRELKGRGIDLPVEDVRGEIEERDQRDRERALAALVPAADAIVVDTSGLSVGQQIEAVLKAVEARVSRP